VSLAQLSFSSFDSSTQAIVEAEATPTANTGTKTKKSAPAGRLFAGRVTRMNYLHPLDPMLTALLIVVLC
jgi:hypothetical protein